jgi:hypothetical protein
VTPLVIGYSYHHRLVRRPLVIHSRRGASVGAFSNSVILGDIH